MRVVLHAKAIRSASDVHRDVSTVPICYNISQVMCLCNIIHLQDQHLTVGFPKTDVTISDTQRPRQQYALLPCTTRTTTKVLLGMCVCAVPKKPQFASVHILHGESREQWRCHGRLACETSRAEPIASNQPA